jgi:hypothetical protein
MKTLTIKRKTKRVKICSSWSINGGWWADITSIHLTIFGVKLMKLHKYYISYRGEFVKI